MTAVVTTLFIDDTISNCRIIRKHLCPGTRCEHIHVTAFGELGNERGREHNVAEEARLNNERCHGSVHLKYCQESFLRNLDRSHLLHSLLSFFLLLEKLAFARDVAA